jgi:dihydroflavonol-4-reductase
MQHALVLGASGHVGNAVVRELLARGCSVTAARRGRTAARNLAGLAVREVLGDADHAATLDRWMGGHDVVIDAAAPYPLTQADRGVVAVSAQRAQVLVDAIVRHRARLIHVGSFVGALDGEELHPYFAAKRAGEMVFAAAAQAGAPVAIVRPMTCMGPWDCRPSALSLVSRVLAGDVTAAPSHLINVIDVRDVARAVVAVGVDGSHPGPLVLGGHNVALSELCMLIGELAGIPVTIQSVPPGAARIGAWAIELATLGTAMPPVPLLTLLALRQTPLSVTAAQRAVGASPRPLSETLRDAIAWVREAPCDGTEAPRDAVASCAPERMRVRRPEPARTEPVRHVMGVFRGATPAVANDDLVSRAVRAGCEVVDQALRRRSGEMPAPLPAMWPGAWLADPLRGASGPPNTAGWLDGMTAALARWVQTVEAWSAMAMPARPPVSSPGGPVDALDVRVELRTARAAAVQLALSPYAGPGRAVLGLFAPPGVAAPPITDVTLTAVDRCIVITLGSIEHHPVATYTGTVVAAGRTCGTLSVRLA